MNYSDEIVDYWINNGILHARFNPVKIEEYHAKHIIEKRLSLYNDKNYKVLIMGEKVKSITKEARDAFDSEISYKFLEKSAFVLNSTLAAFIANFWLNLKTPPVPSRVFSSKESALEWLNK